MGLVFKNARREKYDEWEPMRRRLKSPPLSLSMQHRVHGRGFRSIIWTRIILSIGHSAIVCACRRIWLVEGVNKNCKKAQLKKHSLFSAIHNPSHANFETLILQINFSLLLLFWDCLLTLGDGNFAMVSR